MKYKSVECIIERVNFLKANWSRETFKKLNEIESEMKVKEEEQDYWDTVWNDYCYDFLKNLWICMVS